MPEFTVSLEGRDYDVDAPNERTAYRWASKHHEGFKQRVAAETERGRKEYDPTEDTRLRLPFTDVTVGGKTLGNVAANVGAGVDAFAQGVKQVAGMPYKNPWDKDYFEPGKSDLVSDADVREKRAIDDRLASATQVGGPEWAPRMGKVLQVGGEVLPTLAVPGGAYTSAAKILPKALQASKLARGMVAGAAAGAPQGALMPVTDDESRALNTAVAGGLGAAAPAAFAGVKGTVKGVADFATGRGARREAAQMLGAKPGMQAPADPATLATEGAESVPLSTAATYGSDELARLELASRARGRAHQAWSDFDRTQRQAVAENLEAGTKSAGTERAARLARQEAWDKNAAEAVQQVNPEAWQGEMAKLRANVEAAKRSPQGQNQMRDVLNVIGNQMDELGGEFSPLHLAELRARMSGKVSGSPTDPFRSAPVTDRTYISLKQEFDNILNNATGNKWQNVLAGYKEGSVPVAQGKAETAVQRHFYTPEGTPRVSSPEGTPTVTEANLRKALTGPEMKNTRGTAPTFAPESDRVLKGTLAALERQNILQRTKGTQTGGGGSMTNPLEIAAKSIDPTGGYGVMSYNFFKNLARARAQRELDRALSDPKRYYEIMQEASR